jgi:acetoacetyl-CoA synthetase
VVVGLDRMAPPDPIRGPRWFPGARLNFAENLLRYDDSRPAIVFWNERGPQRSLTFRELHAQVAATAAALRAHGVGVGDRVAGFLPNLPETIVAMLATTSVGAIWSSCSPDFGTNGVLDRFGQIRPRVLFCADGYRYAGKEIDLLARAREVRASIRGIERVVVVPYLREHPRLAGGI